MAFAEKQNTGASPNTDPIRVMVVDDAVVIRGLLTRWLDADAQLDVVGSHRNGKIAVDDIEKSNPDVVVLDIEMPEMDGMTALPLMLAKKRDLVVIMASTLTRRNAEISMKALSLGAADYVPKPESNSEITTSIDFRRELIDKVKALGLRARKFKTPQRSMRAATDAGRVSSQAPVSRAAAPAPAEARKPAFAPTSGAVTSSKAGFSLRPYSSARPRILAIGSSTGGPQALQLVLKDIGAALKDVPVVITQHMPPTFTAILAEHIGKASMCPCKEGADGDVLKPGHIYVAPGGRHMVLESAGTETKIRLIDTAPINFCKPAVDPLFESVAKIYGSAVLSLILTGMGHDGAEGVKTIARGGGSVIAQDEATSVVWGMPGAAANTNMCSDVLPLAEIGPKITRILKGSAR
ncbi:MAG: chemotaxis response regulator protein-glutamate methylesterase [Rhodobacteraceae bacterium]|nr:chemotaxis response regulator protein-glutamate methylesterase [Paracoccaceae bacterium]